MENESESKYTDKINQLLDFAHSNGNIISYTIVADIIRDKEDNIKNDELSEILEMLNDQGIEVTSYSVDEGYAEASEEPAFLPADVKVAQVPVTVYGLMERLHYNEINMHPDFQRKGELWTEEQQCQLIESLILKIPLPAFYFDASEDDKWIVIDGLQRLSALKNFLLDDGHGEYRKLKGFQVLKDCNDKTFKELPRQYIRRIQESTIIVYTVEKGTPKEVVYNIFRRINTGGLVLTNQEIRNALYSGEATKMTEELAGYPEFLAATQNSLKPDRMLDREYVLRFIAFTEMNYKDEYRGNIDNFLIQALKKLNSMKEDIDELERIKQNFRRIMKYCNKILGKYAFRKINMDWRRGPINKAIFEIWSICFSRRTNQELDVLAVKREVLLNKFQKMMQDPMFMNYVKSGDRNSVIRRVDMVEKMLKEIM